MSEAASTSKSQGEFFFGWDLLYKTIESTVNKNSDVLIALAHFVLIKHSKLNCIGVGEDKTLSEDEIGSELLPDGWNDDDNKYALRYMFDNKLYLLLGHITEDCLIINLLDVKTKKVSNIGLDPAEFVKKTKGPLKDLLPSASQLVDRYRRELIEPVFTGNTKEVTTQTLAREERSTDPLRIGEPMRPPVGQYMPVGMEPRPFGFPDVGRGDLDPLGRGGPGNLFPFPSRPDFHGGIGGIGGGGGGVGGQPRFDPYGPPEANLRPNPNPDHLQPPGFGNNDYYM